MPTSATSLNGSRSPVRAGFLGSGFMADVHSFAVRAARGEPVAIASSSADQSAAAALRLGISRSEASVDSLLAAADLDVVHVCTPNDSHAAYASVAIARGLHVVCEKPLATAVKAARSLAEMASRAGVVAAVPFVYRYHPQVREARERLRSGDLGEVHTFELGYLQDWLADPNADNWRVDAATGGGSRAFADIGSHVCDLAEFITGHRIARLSATTRTVYASRAGKRVETEDVAAVIFETDRGAVGTLLVSQVAPGRRNALTVEVHAERGSLRFEQENPEQLWIGGLSASQLLLRDPGSAHPDSGRLSRLPAGHPMGYQDAFTAFVADVYSSIQGSAREGMPTFDDGLRAAVITEAVMESARLRAWVDVDGPST